MTDFNEEGHTHTKREAARKMELYIENQMKAWKFSMCETQFDLKTCELQSFKTFYDHKIFEENLFLA